MSAVGGCQMAFTEVSKKEILEKRSRESRSDASYGLLGISTKSEVLQERSEEFRIEIDYGLQKNKRIYVWFAYRSATRRL